MCSSDLSLDVDEVLGHAREGAADAPLAPGTVVGHLHLHVRDLAEAQDFYSGDLGMTRNVEARAIGFADLSFGGSFPHRMAVNTWQRPGTPRPEGAAGMRHADLHVRRPGATRETGRVADPSGTVIRVLTS